MTELMVTVAIVAILAALAAPNFQATIVKNKLNSIGGEFSAHVIRARNEAASKNTCITMCMSNNSGTATPRCSTAGNDWQLGWIAFLNPTCNAALNNPASPQDVFAARDQGDENYNIIDTRSTNSQRRFFFDSTGISSLAYASRFDISYIPSTSLTLEYGINICVDAMARTRSIPSTSTCENFN